VAEATFKRQPPPRRRLGEIGEQRFTASQSSLVHLDLGSRELRRVGAEEELERCRVVQFVGLAGRLGPPIVERLAPAVGQAVYPPPPPDLLPFLREQSLLGEPRALLAHRLPYGAYRSIRTIQEESFMRTSTATSTSTNDPMLGCSTLERETAVDELPLQGEMPHLPERKTNPFTRSAAGGRILSALMLPFFLLRPPAGFGVLTTTGRKTGKTRRKCIHVVRRGSKWYIVMLRPTPSAIARNWTSAWVLNIRADPEVRLRIRGGTFVGVARELRDTAETQEAAEAYCETVNPFDYFECAFHRSGRPTRAKIEELHRSWFENGIPLEIELQTGQLRG
jgi:deazaflavin-dependent oxidoreductase (nitroreductase family)